LLVKKKNKRKREKMKIGKDGLWHNVIAVRNASRDRRSFVCFLTPLPFFNYFSFEHIHTKKIYIKAIEWVKEKQKRRMHAVSENV